MAKIVKDVNETIGLTEIVSGDIDTSSLQKLQARTRTTYGSRVLQ
jgi:hypothetical protein